MSEVNKDEEILRPGQVGELFGVGGKTVSQWADDPSLGFPHFRTPTGHRRFIKADVLAYRESTRGRQLNEAATEEMPEPAPVEVETAVFPV
jgi:hypothetical protein